MVCTNYDNNKLKNVTIFCDCGCCGYSFKLHEDTVFISVYGDSFYDNQGFGNISLRTFVRKIRKREPIIADLILSADDTKKLIEHLKKFEFSKPDEWTYENISHIEINPIDFDGKILEYELLVVYDGSLWPIIRNKTYRGFEIALKEDAFEKMVKEWEAQIESQN